MANNNSVILTLGYTGTDFTRQMKIDNVDTSDLASVKANIIAFNASITGGLSAANGLAEFFISDDYDDSDSENIVGEFSSIVGAQIIEETTTAINLNGGE